MALWWPVFKPKHVATIFNNTICYDKCRDRMSTAFKLEQNNLCPLSETVLLIFFSPIQNCGLCFVAYLSSSNTAFRWWWLFLSYNGQLFGSSFMCPPHLCPLSETVLMICFIAYLSSSITAFRWWWQMFLSYYAQMSGSSFMCPPHPS